MEVAQPTRDSLPSPFKLMILVCTLHLIHVASSSIENIPLYYQVPLGIELFKLNTAQTTSQATATIKGKIFKKKKLIGSTPFKVVDSSTKKSVYSTPIEFLVNIPTNTTNTKVQRGPPNSSISSAVSSDFNDSQSETSDDSSPTSDSSLIGSGKYVHIVISRRLHTNPKPEFIAETLLDLTHYCDIDREVQSHVSIPVDLAKDVTVNVNLSIVAVVGNQLSRRSGSLDIKRVGSLPSLKTSPTKIESTLSPSETTSPTKTSPQVNKLLVNLDEPVATNKQPSVANTVNNGSDGPVRTSLDANSSMSDFFKRRMEQQNGGRGRSGSSPTLFTKPQSPQMYSDQQQNSPPFTNTTSPFNNSSPLPSDNNPTMEAVLNENQQLKSVLQRAKQRFHDITQENAQLKDRIKELEEQLRQMSLNQPINVPPSMQTIDDFFN